MLPIKYKPDDDDFEDIEKYVKEYDTAPSFTELLLVLAFFIFITVLSGVLINL
jgi:hypothetical protein